MQIMTNDDKDIYVSDMDILTMHYDISSNTLTVTLKNNMGFLTLHPKTKETVSIIMHSVESNMQHYYKVQNNKVV